ncbi:MAG TPA: ABC transporter permease [Candidatus Micrarchaeia archaeon]|nr:ABC transporter permease [Candidatus Micrarchaeia archaeon]
MNAGLVRPEPAAAGLRQAARDLLLVARQLYYEQISFWRNPVGAVFSVGFSVVFLVLLAAAGGTTKVASLGGIRAIQYYVPSFCAYGVMSMCFNTIAIVLVVRRETRLLKRLRLSPLPTWVIFVATVLHALVISLVEVAVLLVIGRLAFDVQLPKDPIALVLALVVGVACFTALGVAVSTAIPNQESAGPIVSVMFFVLLFVSGLWYPLPPRSLMASVSDWFPVRHMITAVFAPFDQHPGVAPIRWGDLLVMAIWGSAGALVAVRRFRWEPRRR